MANNNNADEQKLVLTGRQEKIIFDYTLKAMPLIKNSSEYDSSESKVNTLSRKKVFAYPDSQAATEDPPDLEFVNDFEKAPEPREGLFDIEFDQKSFDNNRKQIPFVKFIPHRFTRKEPALRDLEKFSKSETISSPEQLGSNMQAVTMINISNTVLPSKIKKSLGKLINSYPLLEVLQARNIGMKKVSELKNISRLKWCDLAQNNISDLKELIKFFSRCVFLESIDITGNPVCKKENFRDKIIATDTNLTLRSVNGRLIKPEERARAILTYGTKQAKEDIHYIMWDSILCNLDAVKPMKIWEPEKITKVSAMNMGLQVFHVGELTNLRVLDLSDNRISHIRGNGLERLDRLEKFSLRNNLLKKENIKTFAFMAGLRQLWLEGNKELGNYRLAVISQTRHLRGDNRHQGLLALDNKPITLEERLQALHSADKKADIHGNRWKLACIEYYGHHQLRENGYLTRVQHLKLPDTKLAVVGLQPLPNLQVLDLSHNNLQIVDGLQFLKRLKILNLFGNPLNLEKTLPQISQLTELIHVSLGNPNEKAKNYFKSQSYRNLVLKEVLFNNRWLKWLDSALITPQDRVNTFALTTKDSKQVEEYRFRVGLNISVTPEDRRRWKFNEIEIGKRFDPLKVTKLIQLDGLGLTSDISFVPFVNLVELNLANNRIKHLHTMGLEQAKNLRVLDVHNNQIDTSLKTLAPLIDALSSLQVLCLRGNPCIKDAKDRLLLIGLMHNMRSERSKLRVLDTPITIDERIEAWKKQGGKPDESELLRWKTLMFQRIPDDLPAHNVTILDLTNGGLLNLDLTAFEGLETLLLKNNRLKSIAAIAGISTLKRLRLLDLRKNLLEDMKEIANLITNVPSIASIALIGNKLSESKNYRQHLIDRLPQLHQIPTKFRVIDNVPVTISEIMKNYKISSKASPDRVRMEVIRLMQLETDASADTATQLDCSFSELTLKDIDFVEYKSLEKLSLKNNQIKNKYLLESNLNDCASMRELDLSNNLIKDIKIVHKILNDMPNLEAIWIEGNPLWNDKDENMRAKFLSGIKQMDHLGAKLRLLNGYDISVGERCKGLEIAKVFDKAGLERFRTELIWERWDPEQQKLRGLNLQGNEISSLTDLAPRMAQLATVRVLDLSKNRISSLTELQGLLDKCFKLYALDLRDNNLPGTLRELVKILKTCPGLLHVRLQGAFASRSEASTPSAFVGVVFSMMPKLETCDDIVNPSYPASKRTLKSKNIWSNLPRTPEEARQLAKKLEEDRKKQKEAAARQQQQQQSNNQGNNDTGFPSPYPPNHHAHFDPNERPPSYDLLPPDSPFSPSERPPSYGSAPFNPELGQNMAFPPYGGANVGYGSINNGLHGSANGGLHGSANGGLHGSANGGLHGNANGGLHGSANGPYGGINNGPSAPATQFTPTFTEPSGNYEFQSPIYSPNFDFSPSFAASAPSIATLKLRPTDLPAFFSESQSPNMGNDSLYPDLGFSAENYLPTDYHGTIGRKVDLSELANALKKRADEEEDEEDSPWKD